MKAKRILIIARLASAVALCVCGILASPPAPAAMLTADASANVSAGRNIGGPTKLIMPGPGSLAVTIGAAASDSIPRDPGPGNHEYTGILTGSGAARYGSLAGRAHAEASSRPAGDFDPFGAGGQVSLQLGFLDTAQVVSTTLTAGTPVTLTFVMTLDGTATHFADGPFPLGRIGAGVRNEAKIIDLEANTSTPNFSPHTLLNSRGDYIPLTTFQFVTAIGHHLEIDVDLIVAAGAIIDAFPSFGAASQGIADVIADQTARFFYQPSGDVRLVSESGHDYANPPANVALFGVVQAGASGPPYPTQSIIADVVTQPIPTNPNRPVERLKLSLFDVAAQSPISPVAMEVSANTAADASALDVAFRLAPTDPCASCIDGSVVDLLFELEAHPDSGAAPILIPTDPCVGCNGVSEFDVPFDVFVEGVGMMHNVAHFEINVGQPMVFDNVIVGAPQSPAFHITFNLLSTEGEVMTAENLFSVTITATAVPEPATTSLCAICAILFRRRPR